MQDFLSKVKELWEIKRKTEEKEEELNALKETLNSQKSTVLKEMEALELEKMAVPGHGTVYRKKSFSVKVPKDPSQKSALFDWIKNNKGEEVLQNMLSINSMTLNSFYQAELEVAKEAGNIDWRMDGVSEPEVYFQLAMRK